MTPNHKAEINLSDNSLCKDFTLSDLKNTNISTGFSFYPNPAEDKIYLKYERQNAASYVIMDMEGRKLQGGPIAGATTEVDLSGMRDGIYILQVKSSSGSWSGKFVIK